MTLSVIPRAASSRRRPLQGGAEGGGSPNRTAQPEGSLCPVTHSQPGGTSLLAAAFPRLGLGWGSDVGAPGSAASQDIPPSEASDQV